jgi:hypothetical protein
MEDFLMINNNIEKRLERMEDIWEVQKVMSKYEYYLTAGMGEEIITLFARKTPGVTANLGDWGIFKGIDGIRKLFIGLIGTMMQKEGCLGEADLTNPLIEIAGDGKTAKAVWMAPGFETTRDPRDGKIRAGWCWTKYACDFVKEDKEWKIWHYNNFLTFFSDYNKSWAEGGEHYSRIKGAEIPFPSEFSPDGPPIHRHAPYFPNTKREFFPAFPLPYETYNGNQEWIDPRKPTK